MTKRPKPPKSRRSTQRRIPRSPRTSNRSTRGRPRRASGRSGVLLLNWQWTAIVLGGALLLFALFLVGKAFIEPSPTPVLPTATMAIIITPSPTQDVASQDASPSPSPDTSNLIPPDIPELQKVMQELINEDRRKNGLSEVAWDETAAVAGTQHAIEMAQYGYISHYNLDGYGPDYRYSLAGGLHTIQENIHLTKYSMNNTPQSANEWEQLVRKAQESLMGSEGHRNNILSPEHTHVGIGIAHDMDDGYFAITQEFVNQYLTLQPIPHSVSLGETVNLLGWLNSEASDPILNLAYEPLPKARSLDDLQAESYVSPSETYLTPPINVSEDGQLTASFKLNNDDQLGLYHVRIWADTKFGQVQTTNLVIRVQ